MARKTVLIVPATVADARVTRVPRTEAEGPGVVSAEPGQVAAAEIVPVVPDQLTPEQVAQLRDENRALRLELARVRHRQATPTS